LFCTAQYRSYVVSQLALRDHRHETIVAELLYGRRHVSVWQAAERLSENCLNGTDRSHQRVGGHTARRDQPGRTTGIALDSSDPRADHAELEDNGGCRQGAPWEAMAPCRCCSSSATGTPTG
jgi:hypothetical protein